MDREETRRGREFLRDRIRLDFDFSATDQHRGVPPPPAQKPCPPGSTVLSLPPAGEWEKIPPTDLVEAIGGRRSRRSYRSDPFTLEEISFLLWAVQGVRRRVLP